MEYAVFIKKEVYDIEINSVESVKKYLNTIRIEKLRIIKIPIKGRRIIEVEPNKGNDEVTIGSKATEDGLPIVDGIYQLENGNVYYQIQNGEIKNIFLKEKKYITKNGEEIFIRHQNIYKINNGDLVVINGKLIEEAIIDFNYFKIITVKDGKILKIEFKNRIIKVINNFLDSILNLAENPNETDLTFNWYFKKVMLIIILLTISLFGVVYFTK